MTDNNPELDQLRVWLRQHPEEWPSGFDSSGTDDDLEVALLETWLGSHPEEWAGPDASALSQRQMHAIADRITGESRHSDSDDDAEVISLTAEAPRPNRRRRRRAALIGAPIVVIALAAATWAVVRSPATQVTALSCQADGVTTVIPNDGTSPVEACAKLWETGVMNPNVHIAPTLVACVSHGAVAVIPGDGADDCTAKNMTLWSGHEDGSADGTTARGRYQSVGAATQAVRYALMDRFKRTGNFCATEADWRRELQTEPAFDGWTVGLVPPPRHSGHCVDIGEVDIKTHTLQLAPVGDTASFVCAPPRFPC